ncbi:hypothetical protein LOD99_7525 [Oopsacas minuta]|uniref:Uncharacterized protein n=1 Tax=Oopsacas minuta TaxID=111878 RepID=A0AAV7JWR5_9METZ|nr:hypothetical protein LOD99_7525 [Oopsacas minuta]
MSMDKRKKPSGTPSNTSFFAKKSRLGGNTQREDTEDTASMHTDSDSDSVDDSSGSDVRSEGEVDSLVECDIGKLQDSHIFLQQLSRDQQHRILTTEPNSDPSSYPRTCPYPSSSLRQFQPS